MLVFPFFKLQLFRTCFIAKIAQTAKIKGILISLKTHIRKIARSVDLWWLFDPVLHSSLDDLVLNRARLLMQTSLYHDQRIYVYISLGVKVGGWYEVNMVHAHNEWVALKLFKILEFFCKNTIFGPGQFWWPLSSKGASGEEIELDCCVKISRTNCRKHRAKKSSHPRELRLTSWKPQLPRRNYLEE